MAVVEGDSHPVSDPPTPTNLTMTMCVHWTGVPAVGKTCADDGWVHKEFEMQRGRKDSFRRRATVQHT